MDVEWGMSIRFGLLDDEPDDVLDHVTLAADSEDPRLRVRVDDADVGTLREVVAGAAVDSAPGMLDTPGDVC